MTIGIYSLYWEEQDLIYIGQSQNIEKRFTEHLYKLNSNTHHNWKVQEAYHKYGDPVFNILEECSLPSLNDREVYWTEEFNSLNSSVGLNIISAGDAGRGTTHACSKFSRKTILKVFVLLYKSKLSLSKIASRTNTTKTSVAAIKAGYSHLWLKEEFPIEYKLMCSNCSMLEAENYESKHTSVAVLISPNKELYTISSITEFCKQIPIFASNMNSSRPNISKLLANKISSYKGWRLLEK